MIKLTRWAATALLAASTTIQAADLQQVFDLAYEQDRSIRAARADLQAIREKLPQARSAFAPQVGLEGSTGYAYSDSELRGTSDFGNYNLKLTAGQSLYNRANRLLEGKTEKLIARAEEGLAAAEQKLVLDTASAYFDVLSAMDNLEFARAEKTAVARQLDQTRERFEVGLIAITDVHEAQARNDLTLAQELVAINRLDNAREALAEITGGDVGELDRVSTTLPLDPPMPNNMSAWVTSALEGNPGIAAARLGVEVARDDVAIQSAADDPKVSLGAQLSYGDTTSEGSGWATNAGVTLSVTMPLSTGGRTAAATREAAYAQTAAEERLEQQQRSVTRNTREAFRNVNAAISQVQALQQALVSTQSALEATEAGFEVGTRTVVDVLNAQRELFRAQRDLAGARYGYLVSTLGLKLAAGSLTGDQVAAINALLR